MKHLPKDLLKWTAAGFALAATATAEYEIARAIGMNEWIAAAVPGALDAYVVRALRTHREVLTAVLAMVGVNAASHLVTAGILPVEWPLITAVSAIAPLVLWRVHALGTPGDWRARTLWDLSKDEHAAVLASTEPEHTTSTDQARVRAQTDAWGDDWLDVADAVHEPITPPVPVHAPYVDRVLPPDLPSTRPMPTRHLEIVHEHTTSTVCLACQHPEHNGGRCEHGFCDCVHFPAVAEHTASTRTAEDWNLEHVSTGVLDPEDTEHMERARELFHTIGSVPPFRALKEGTPGMGTPRAQRIRAALKIENEGTD